MNSLMMDVTANVLSTTRKFTNTDWQGIIRDMSLLLLKQYQCTRVTGGLQTIDPIEEIKVIQWRYGFDMNDMRVANEFIELYNRLARIIIAYVETLQLTNLLTVVHVSTDNNIFQLHLGYA
jgi:hypothetical protein